MNASDDEVLQLCYREIALLEYWLENPQYDREIAEERGQCSETEENVADEVADEIADEIAGDEPKHVAEGQEVWEVATSMAAAAAATSIVTAETTMIAAKEALKPYDFYSNNCFVSTGLTEEAGESLLDKEIKMMMRRMVKESRTRRGAATRGRQQKIARVQPVEQRSIRYGDLEKNNRQKQRQMETCSTKYGIQAHDQEIMINFKVGCMMQEHLEHLHL